MQVTICDFCGNRIEGDRVLESRQVIQSTWAGGATPTQRDLHPECANVTDQLTEQHRPVKPELPGSGPNLPDDLPEGVEPLPLPPALIPDPVPVDPSLQQPTPSTPEPIPAEPAPAEEPAPVVEPPADPAPAEEPPAEPAPEEPPADEAPTS